MVYGYDQAIQLPVRDLYDSGIMLMALGVAKDMYEKGEKRIDDFYTKYGDFITPIQKDQDYYNKNVIDAVRNSINSLYANGGDPLRNAQSRAELARVIRNIPYGEINKLKASAKNAEEYLKERARLEAAGLYNPELEQFAGKSLDLFSTLDDGIWDRMSPVPYLNMAEFSKAFFDNIKPFKTSASKNGISYTKAEINMDDLRRIARSHHNDLVNTPQGQLMYAYYKNKYGSDEAAKNAFDEAVVSGNIDRLYYEDDYNDNWLKRRGLQLQEQEAALSRDKFNWEKRKFALEHPELFDPDNSGGLKDKDGKNYYQDQFDRGLNFFTYGNAGMPSLSLKLDLINGVQVLKAAQKNVGDLKSINRYSSPEDRKNNKNSTLWNTARDRYLSEHVAKGLVGRDILTATFGGQNGNNIDKSKSYTVFVAPDDVKRLHDDDFIVSHTFGVPSRNRNPKIYSDDGLKDDVSLNWFKAGGNRANKLKMQFSDYTYTAPIVMGDEVKMVQFLKVHLYGMNNDSDLYIGDRWFAVRESDPTKAHVTKTKNKQVVRTYRSVPTTVSSESSGEMQYHDTEAEHALHSTSEGKHNTLTRY